MNSSRFWPLLAFAWAFPLAGQAVPMEPIRVSNDGSSFVLAPSKAKFTPWGVNYDHDRSNRLLEEYWVAEWDTVVNDFEEIKALGANTVRVHLQVSAFMNSETELNEQSLNQLGKLLALAGRTGLYLDVTGLGCYNRKDVPKWYNDLNEQDRWRVQARFWAAVAKKCAASSILFCYDLMNEPIVTEDKSGRDWTPGEFAGKCFVQRLTVNFAGRTPEQIAKTWVDQMVSAIRQSDSNHLVTVGAIPWAHEFPGAKPLFYSKAASEHLDFVSLHFYPKQGAVEKALTALEVYRIGKPILIEEMFPLNCSIAELDQFVQGSQKIAAGWIGFYWGKTIDEYRNTKQNIGDSMALSWLEYFSRKPAGMRASTNGPVQQR